MILLWLILVLNVSRYLLKYVKFIFAKKSNLKISLWRLKKYNILYSKSFIYSQIIFLNHKITKYVILGFNTYEIY